MYSLFERDITRNYILYACMYTWNGTCMPVWMHPYRHSCMYVWGVWGVGIASLVVDMFSPVYGCLSIFGPHLALSLYLWLSEVVACVIATPWVMASTSQPNQLWVDNGTWPSVSLVTCSSHYVKTGLSKLLLAVNPFLQPKQKKKETLIPGSWNVCILLDTADTLRLQTRTALIAIEPAHYRIDISTLIEKWFAEKGSIFKPEGGYIFLGGGKAEHEDRMHGLGFAI